ncbi:MAG: anti-sigma factor antagonist [Spirochaetia bacterium]|nr:anti-sigma factor antagonist [Spirochaetia bacterium]
MNIKTRTTGPHFILELKGELNLYLVGEARKQILDILGEAAPVSLVIDCKELSYMDSSGIGLFIQLMRRQRNLPGHQFHLVGVNQKTLDTMRGANLHSYFVFADSVELIAEASVS